MADPKQDKKQEKSSPSSEGFGFKQSPLGFDKNEVNLYINKLKKQMKEQEQEFENRLNNLRKNLEDAHDEQNAAKEAAKNVPAQPATIIGNTDADVIKAVNDAKAETKKEYDAKIMELRKQVLDERRNVAKLDKECAMAQMSEKKVREEYAKLKEKYHAAKKAGGGGKAVVTSNADEILDEACKMAEQIIESANAYAKSSIDSVNEYKAKVEAELKNRSEKLASAKKQLDDQSAKAAKENEAAKQNIKEIADKISVVTSQLGSFASSFDAVNTQITAVTTQIDAVTGQFGTVTAQINEATSTIEGVTKQFGTVTQQITEATATFDGVSKQFETVNQQITAASEAIGGVSKEFENVSGKLTAAKDSFGTASEAIGGVSKEFENVSGKLTEAKDSFGSVSDTLTKAKDSFGDVTKSVTETKDSIAGIKTHAAEAVGLTASIAPAGTDTGMLDSVSAAIAEATSEIKAELTLPEFKAAFDKSAIEELKKKLKVETTYEGGVEDDEDDEDEDILSSIEIDEIPETPAPTDEELMADLPALEPEPVKEEKKPEPAPNKPEKKAAPVDDDLSDFLITPTTEDSSSLINTTSVGAIDDFSLDAEPEPLGADFDLAPNDLTAAPEKGSDLGEDIFDMAINPVDADDQTLSNMMTEQKVKEEIGDFELTPAEIKDEYKPSTTSINDDFGEFADLFAAGSAETTAETPKKKQAAFRQSSSSDDPFNFGSDSTDSTDDDDMSSDSDFSDFLL